MSPERLTTKARRRGPDTSAAPETSAAPSDPFAKTFDDDRDGWVSMRRMDWRYLDGPDYRILSELSYQQFHKLKNKAEPRYPGGINGLARTLSMTWRTAERALKRLEERGYIRTEPNGHGALIVEVLHAPGHKVNGIPVVADDPPTIPAPKLYKKSPAPTRDPVTGEILPRPESRLCAGKTISGERCRRRTRDGDYCQTHWLPQDPYDISTESPYVETTEPQNCPYAETSQGVPIVRDSELDSAASSESFFTEHPELYSLSHATHEQVRRIRSFKSELRLSRDAMVDLIEDVIGIRVAGSGELTQSQADEVIEHIEAQRAVLELEGNGFFA